MLSGKNRNKELVNSPVVSKLEGWNPLSLYFSVGFASMSFVGMSFRKYV